MSKQREKIFSKTDCFPLETILRYVQDRSSMKERNRLERHMLDCDLCREAVEGYELMANKENASQIVSDLNKRLEVKSDDSFIMRRIAAGVGAFIILGGGLYYLNHNLNNKEECAIVINKKEADSVAKNSPSQVQKSDEVIAMDKKVEVPGAEKSSTIEVYENKEPSAKPQVDYRSNGSGAALSLPPKVMEDDVVSEERISDLNAVVEAEAPALEESMKDIATPSSGVAKKEEISNKGDEAKRVRSVEKSKVSSSAYSAPSANIAMNEANLIDQAIQKYNEKKYAEASVLLEQYLKTDSDNAKALYYNGLSYFEASNWNRAIDNFTHVNKASDFYEDARWKQASSLINKGDKKAAKKLLTEISESDSKYKQQALEELKKL